MRKHHLCGARSVDERMAATDSSCHRKPDGEQARRNQITSGRVKRNLGPAHRHLPFRQFASHSIDERRGGTVLPKKSLAAGRRLNTSALPEHLEKMCLAPELALRRVLEDCPNLRNGCLRNLGWQSLTEPMVETLMAPQVQAHPFSPRSGFGRLEPIDHCQANGRNRRVSPVSARPGEGPLTEPIAGVQPAARELVFMPRS